MALRRLWPGVGEAIVVGAVVASASAVLSIGLPPQASGRSDSSRATAASRVARRVPVPSNLAVAQPEPCATDPGLVDCILATAGTATSADLGVTMEADPVTVEADDPVTYTVQVTNAGPATATGVRLRDQIPDGSRFVSSSWPSCTFADGFVDCLLATVATVTTRTVSFVVRPRLPGEAWSTVTVSSDLRDPIVANDSASTSVTVTAPPFGDKQRFHQINPCRVFDTRDLLGPTGGQPMTPAFELTYDLGGACGVSPEAMSVSVNVTVTGSTGNGILTIYPADQPFPGTVTAVISAGRARANNTILRLSADAARSVTLRNTSDGTVHVILDVNGYFAFP